jgi:hypothetical protein
MIDTNNTAQYKAYIVRGSCGTDLHLTDLVQAGSMSEAAEYHLSRFLEDVRECGIEPAEVCVTVRPLHMPTMKTTGDLYVETFMTAF